MTALPAWDINKYLHKIANTKTIRVSGKVTDIVGLLVEAKGLVASLGEVLKIYNGSDYVQAEVVGFKKGAVLMMPLDMVQGLAPGCKVSGMGEQAAVPVGPGLLGRVLNGLGRPIDNKAPIKCDDLYPLYAPPLNPLLRARIKEPLDLGLRAVNGLLTCGKGQRMGIFPVQGWGKVSCSAKWPNTVKRK